MAWWAKAPEGLGLNLIQGHVSILPRLSCSFPVNLSCLTWQLTKCPPTTKRKRANKYITKINKQKRTGFPFGLHATEPSDGESWHCSGPWVRWTSSLCPGPCSTHFLSLKKQSGLDSRESLFGCLSTSDSGHPFWSPSFVEASSELASVGHEERERKGEKEHGGTRGMVRPDSRRKITLSLPVFLTEGWANSHRRDTLLSYIFLTIGKMWTARDRSDMLDN